ncbi:MAG: type transport system permease protein, partial [Actinomycetota bacterium]|nr:type transport system permease protein [Actinomycetota bacterium]
MPPVDPSAEWHENAADLARGTAAWAALWRSRDLVGYFALRDLRVRYKQAVLGVLWVLLQPIASVVIFSLVFGRLANINSQGVPYPLFALLGMVVWTYFSSATTRGSEVFASSPELVTKVSFPRLAAPAAAMLPPLVDLVVSMALVAILFVYYDVVPTWRLALSPVWIMLLVLTAFAPSLWLSALNVRYRDVRQAVGPAMQIWLFASPVAYPSTLLSPTGELLYALNPMAGVIGLARWSVLGTPWPGWPLAVSLVT